jgi:TerC family integral membrane protein
MRGALIGIGVALIHEFHWVLYGFGFLLIYAGVKMMLRKEGPVKLEKNRTIEWARKYLPLTDGYAGQKFFVRRGGIWRATPLVLVLLVMETTDLTFAIDSIPAVFSITRDPFIVYTSNVCAILGLRALYFLLAGALPYFRYLDRGLSIVLLFIGGKMLVEPWLKIPTYAALLAVGAILGIAAAASLANPRVLPLVAPTKNPAEPAAKTKSES